MAIYVWRDIGEYKPYEPTSYTYAYWKLNGNTNDSGPNKKVLSGTPPTFGGGGFYGIFNDNVMTCSMTVQSNITVSCWLRVTDFDNANMYFFAIGDASTTRAYFGLNSLGRLAIYHAETTRAATVSYPAGQWFNLTYTYNSRAYKIYLNGELVYQYDVSGGYQIYGTKMYVGGKTAAEGWRGYMSELVVENNIWSATQTLTYFNDTKGLYGL